MNNPVSIAVIAGESVPSFFCVDWSYPTSENAKRFKCPNGCWTVGLTYSCKDSRGRDCLETKAKAGGFATREQAQAWADVNLSGIRQLKAPARRVALDDAMSKAV